MSLDLFVSGPGFGETIILKWTSDGIPRAALIDCYAPHRGRPLVDWLDELGIDHFSFAVATHPHLDHIKNMYQIMAAFSHKFKRKPIDRLWWWGGLAQWQYTIYFDKLAQHAAMNNIELGSRADALKNLFAERAYQFRSTGKPELTDIARVNSLYPVGDQKDSNVTVRSISPWDGPLTRFTQTVLDGIRPGNEVRDNHREANQVSIGLLVEYGKAQILLGSDIETENWRALIDSTDCPTLNPCVVKVSHHGSRNGCVDGMWHPQGFFEKAGSRPIAVITPWKDKLPEGEIINQIRKTCREVYITGKRPSGRSHRPLNSFVHIRVEQSGEAEVLSTSENVERLLGTS